MGIKDILAQIDLIPIENIGNPQFLLQIKQQKQKLSASDKRVLSKEISGFRRTDVEHILRRIVAYSIWCPDEAIEVARKKGVFRYKAWGLRSNLAEYLLQHIQQYYPAIPYSEATRQFIDTKIRLSWIFEFYKKSENYLIRYIAEHHKERKCIRIGDTYVEEALFKELLAYVDILFYSQNRKIDHINKSKISGYGREEISESISYLIYLYDVTLGIKQNCSYTLSSKYVLSHEIEDIILIGCKVHQLQEWEVCIDYFNYQLKISENNYVIYNAEQIFEKSIQLGYIRRDMQADLFYLENMDRLEGEAINISDISKYIKNELGDQFIFSTGTGKLSRYYFKFTEPFLSLFKNNKVFACTFFKEELLAISHCAKEFILTIEDTLNKKITENCTLYDVVMFQRFFNLINIVAEQTLFQKKDKQKIIRSLIPAFQFKKLIEILTVFMGDQAKSEELLRLFTYRKSVKLDLQYTPFLQSSNGLVFSTSLVSKSNLLRNCIAYSYLSKNKTVNQDDREPLVAECKKIFSVHYPEYRVFTNKRFSYKNQNGEIDVIVISDNDIIIIECKSPLNPTNNFEMRASFDHLNKASKQLNHSKSAFSDSSFRKVFLKNLDVTDTPRDIYTCIVFGNRLFNGYTIDSHPIRYVRELDMVLNNGHIYSEAGIWRVWEQEEYSHRDLISFISPDYALGVANFNSMDKIEKYMFVKGKKVCFETYKFNMVKAIRQYDRCFAVEQNNDDLRKRLDCVYEKIN